MAEFIIWMCILFIGYTYAGYPVILWFLSKDKYNHLDDKFSYEPVTVVMCAYNEENNIANKIDNLKNIYPEDLLKIIVVSDASTDETDDIVNAYDGVKLIRMAEQGGKPVGINKAVAHVDTKWLMLCDVRQRLSQGSFEALLKALQSDVSLGIAFAELEIESEDNQERISIGLYWRYEKWIRKMESQLCSTLGVTGACYMLKTDKFVPFDADIILDDVQLPIKLLREGFVSKLISDAVIYDVAQSDMDKEKNRKIRTLAGNFQLLARHPWLLSLGGYPCSWQFISHKFCRLMVPLAGVILLFSLLLAQGWAYRLMLMGYLLLLLLVPLAWFVPSLKKMPIISTLIVFIEMNLAIVQGFIKWSSSDLNAKWK